MKKRVMLGIVITVIMLFWVGCSAPDTTGTPAYDTELVPQKQSQSNLDTYVYEGEIIFVPVTYQHIDDGTMNGLDLIRYVDLNTGVLYLYTEKYYSGYGITWEMLVDEFGNPLKYDNIDALREKYGCTK